LWFALLTNYCSGYQIAKDERGKTCSTYGGEGKYRQVMVEKPEGKGQLEQWNRMGGVEWIVVA
jgi:hypothetical protein